MFSSLTPSGKPSSSSMLSSVKASSSSLSGIPWFLRQTKTVSLDQGCLGQNGQSLNEVRLSRNYDCSPKPARLETVKNNIYIYIYLEPEGKDDATLFSQFTCAFRN